MKGFPYSSGNLDDCLKELHLPGIRSCYKDSIALAAKDGLSYNRGQVYVCTLNS
jgi:hypothetical protein